MWDSIGIGYGYLGLCMIMLGYSGLSITIEDFLRMFIPVRLDLVFFLNKDLNNIQNSSNVK